MRSDSASASETIGLIAATQPGSPGQKAGSRVGDIIYRFEGRPVAIDNPIMALRDDVIPLKLRGNVTRTIGVLRDGVELELRVTWPTWNWEKPKGEIRDLPDRQADGAA